MTYDVHAHGVPPLVVAAIQRDDGRCGVTLEVRDDGRWLRVAGGGGPLRPEYVDLDARLAFMDKHGVDVQLLSSWIGITGYALPIEQGARWARLFNEALAETVAAHPTRLRGLCNVPLQSGQHAAAELRHAVQELGHVGAEIATTVDGRELDDPELEPFWAAAAELRCLIVIHPDQVLPGRPEPRHFLNNLVGNAAETTIAVGHLLFAGVLERYPDLRIVLVHGGGYLPYQVGRLDHGYTASPRAAAEHITRPPSEQLRRLYFDTVTHSHEVLRFLVNFAGPEHVVLGSDYPFDMGQPDPVAFVRSLPGLDEAQCEQILTHNVQALLDDVQRS